MEFSNRYCRVGAAHDIRIICPDCGHLFAHNETDSRPENYVANERSSNTSISSDKTGDTDDIDSIVLLSGLCTDDDDYDDLEASTIP